MIYDRSKRLFILPLLGALSVITPFSIDMCLPAFPEMAKDFTTTTAVISLALSTYFIGLALGQLLYGPLLDRFGRKPPLYVGLGIFIAASLGCCYAHDIHTLLALRFVQALGGCAAQVASVAMVRDFFPSNESARVFSILFLFIGVSPLFAPTAGSIIVAFASWRIIFAILACIAVCILALVACLLPEGHIADKSISLKPKPIIEKFLRILMHPRFYTYALAGAFSFAGLFTYVAGSPIIFMEQYHLSTKAYGAVFAFLGVGFIGGNQLNVSLLRRFGSRNIFAHVLFIQTITGVLFFIGTALGLLNLWTTLTFLFVFLACAGLIYPNAAALALEPFTKNTGSASALLGLLQLGIGAVISSGISVLSSKTSLPIIAILALTTIIGLFIYLGGKKSALKLTLE